MARRARTSTLETWLARLLDDGDEGTLHRVLLEATIERAGARGAALWVRTARGWNALAAAGEIALLPEEARARALLEAPSSEAALRPGERVLAPAGRCLALLLAGAAEEDALDEIEALLLVRESTLDPDSLELPPLPRKPREG